MADRGSAEQGGATITIHCKHGKETHAVSISPDATVQDLKEKLQNLTNVLPRGQKLIFKGKMLDTNTRLRDAALSNLSKVMMIGSSGVHQGSVTPVKETGIRILDATVERKGRFEISDGVTGRKGRFSIVDNAADRTEWQRGKTVFFSTAWEATGIISLRDRNQEAIPNQVWAIGPSARVLDLGGNRLKSFPGDVCRLVNLKKLHLSTNGFKDEQIDWQGITTLKQLTMLALDHNLLTQIPPEVGLLCELRHFSVSHNKLDQVSEDIGNLTKLEKMDLSHNSLTKLPSALGQCCLLIEANFSANLLREIPSSLGDITRLKALNLDNNALKTFPNKILKGCLELATLSLHGNELTIEYLRELEGWAEFDERRKAKHSKQLEFSLLDLSGGFDEGADSQQWHHW